MSSSEPKVVAIADLKGGVSKTTTSMTLAEMAARSGQKAKVLDSDPQASALVWAETAADAGDPLKFDVELAPKGLLKRLVGKQQDGKPLGSQFDADWVFIDTPPGDSELIEAAVTLADFVIIPAPPKPADFRQAMETYHRLAKAGVPAAVFLSCFNVRATDVYNEVKEIIEEEGIVTFATEIPERTGIVKLWYTGMGAKKLHGYEDLYAELVNYFDN